VVERMLELARVGRDDVVYDLGCGDGRIVVTAARTYGCRAVGFDIDRECVRLAREKAREQGVGHLVRIEREDLFTQDLSGRASSPSTSASGSTPNCCRNWRSSGPGRGSSRTSSASRA
jgi:ribosomal protein L11 methylase PrmA